MQGALVYRGRHYIDRLRIAITTQPCSLRFTQTRESLTSVSKELETALIYAPQISLISHLILTTKGYHVDYDIAPFIQRSILIRVSTRQVSRSLIRIWCCMCDFLEL